MQNLPASTFTVLVILATAATLVVAGGAVASGPERGNAATITVAPSDELAPVQTVAVSGARFVSSKDIQIIQCSALLGTGARGPQDVVCTAATLTTADASGSFGPVSFDVARTFTGTTGGRDPQPATHTCAASEDCVVYAISVSTKLRFAFHHLSFAG
jgi:hypothetical protein